MIKSAAAIAYAGIPIDGSTDSTRRLVRRLESRAAALRRLAGEDRPSDTGSPPGDPDGAAEPTREQ